MLLRSDTEVLGYVREKFYVRTSVQYVLKTIFLSKQIKNCTISSTIWLSWLGNVVRMAEDVPAWQVVDTGTSKEDGHVYIGSTKLWKLFQCLVFQTGDGVSVVEAPGRKY